jgi:hypothetical protein
VLNNSNGNAGLTYNTALDLLTFGSDLIVSNLAEPTFSNAPATKFYVDSATNGIVAGDTDLTPASNYTDEATNSLLLEGMSNVNTTGLSGGHILMWDGTDSWTNGVDQTGGGGGDLTDATNYTDQSVTNLSNLSIGYQTITYTDTNVTWAGNNGVTATVTLTNNAQLANITGVPAGTTLMLIVKQDATGSRTLSYDTAYAWPGGTAPLLSTGANEVDIIQFIYDGTTFYGVASYKFE